MANEGAAVATSDQAQAMPAIGTPGLKAASTAAAPSTGAKDASKPQQQAKATAGKGEGADHSLQSGPKSSTSVAQENATSGTTEAPAEVATGAPVPDGGDHTATAPAVSATASNAAAEGDAGEGASLASRAGRWRLSVHVPAAQVQDLLPAAQLLSAANQPGGDYGAAKASFLDSLHTRGAGLTADELRRQVDVLSDVAATSEPKSKKAKQQAAAKGAAASSSSLVPSTPGSSSSSGSSAIPGLQDLAGRWSGRIEVFGGGDGATNIDFALKGDEWRWVRVLCPLVLCFAPPSFLQLF